MKAPDKIYNSKQHILRVSATSLQVLIGICSESGSQRFGHNQGGHQDILRGFYYIEREMDTRLLLPRTRIRLLRENSFLVTRPVAPVHVQKLKVK